MRVIIVQPRFITTYTSLRKGREFGLCYSAWAGDQVWRKINTSNNAKHFVDAICFQNQFYAIDAFGLIFAVKDDDGTTTRVAELPTEFIEMLWSTCMWLNLKMAHYLWFHGGEYKYHLLIWAT